MPPWNTEPEYEQLEAFAALFREKSVTRAAASLGRTQSAVSKQLGRLRELFNDPLFSYTDREMVPTPRATRLHPGILDVMLGWSALLEPETFAPGDIDSRFTLSTTDEVQNSLVSDLYSRLHEQAPGATLAVTPLREGYSQLQLESGAVNAVISVNWSAPEHLVQKHLFQDEFVCVMRKKHALGACTLTRKRYISAEHLVVAPLGGNRGIVDDALKELDLSRHTRMFVPHFLQCGSLLESTDLICVLPHRAALELSKHHSLVVRRVPIPLPKIDYYLFYHQRYRNDREQVFLRRLIIDCAKQKLGKKAPR